MFIRAKDDGGGSDNWTTERTAAGNYLQIVVNTITLTHLLTSKSLAGNSSFVELHRGGQQRVCIMNGKTSSAYFSVAVARPPAYDE